MLHEWDVESHRERKESGCSRILRADDGRSLRNEEALEKSCFSTVVASEGETLAEAPRVPNKSLWNFGSLKSDFDLLLWGHLAGTWTLGDRFQSLPTHVAVRSADHKASFAPFKETQEFVLHLCRQACLYPNCENLDNLTISHSSFRKYNLGSDKRDLP